MWGPYEHPQHQRLGILGGIAAGLHLVLDPVVTYLVVQVYDVGRELNPLFVEAINNGIVSFAIILIPSFVVFGLVYIGQFWLFRFADPSETEWLHRFFTVAWSINILWGLLLVGNNLFVLLSAFY